MIFLLFMLAKGGVPARERLLDTPSQPLVDILAVAYSQNKNIFVLQLQDNVIVSNPQLPVALQSSSEGI